MSAYIYKICPAPLWEEACKRGEFTGAEIDISDGYIHFSTARQVRETASKHFSGQGDLNLIQLDASKLDIIWERSRGGQLFPHLYASLPLNTVTATWTLPLDEHGLHIFPELD